ncbi:FkbM family methyltransferase [uncultured Bradyrhizobium sp.]|uniref:FkbM family methyltransferase n=1 Tax=uncultured Bradyrhizobium sp. TaxID=199684 RepID=UPI002638FFF8|nr:FkbM family methyltransferase [uncultured Bradyrhizobium sp.]
MKRAFARLLRPYIYRELPGWGFLYLRFVGGYEADAKWRGPARTWMRGKLHGYEMSLDLGNWSNRQTYFLGRFYDLPTQLVLLSCLRPDDIFVDIGANEGMISLLASRLVGPDGKVLAFEPNPAPRTIFTSAVQRNEIKNIQIFPVGLGQREQILTLNVPKANSGEASFAGSNYSAGDLSQIECEVKVADQFLRTESPRLIKIDVEGFELDVLQGLNKTLEQSRPGLVLEMDGQLARNAGTNLGDASAFLQVRGYRPFRMSICSRRKLRLTSQLPAEDAHADFLWLHPSNAILDPADFIEPS